MSPKEHFKVSCSDLYNRLYICIVPLTYCKQFLKSKTSPLTYKEIRSKAIERVEEKERKAKEETGIDYMDIPTNTGNLFLS